MQNNWAGPVILGSGTRDFNSGELGIEFDDGNALLDEKLEFGPQISEEPGGVQSQVQGVNRAAFQHGIPPSSIVIKIKVEILKRGLVMHEIKTQVKDYSCREKVKGIIPTVINLSCCPPAGYPCDNSLTERQEANEKTEKAIKKGELCYVGFVKQNLFQIVFGSVEPDQTIRVTFKYFVPLGPSLELRLPFSFLPKLLTNPGTVDQNKPIRGGMSVTVKYPEYISGITDMKTNQPLELDVNSSQQELNLHWKFNVKKQFDDQSTRVSVFEFSEIVPQTSHLWGKVGVVIDHRIELQPTQLRNHNLQFMVDFSSAMSDDFKQAIATAISEYVEGLDSSEGISVICFGRSSSSWPADTTTLRNWFSTMRDQQFGKLDTGSLAQKLGDMYQSPYNNSPRQIILITNTKPLDYRDVTQVINGARAIDTEHNRTFAIGIDDVSMSLCEDISQQTGGKAEFCCNHLTFAGYLQKQVSRALSKPSFRLSEFNVSVTGIDPQMVRDPSDFIDSGFNTVQLGSHIFGGLPTVDIGSDLEGCVAHIQTGLILEEFDHLETKPIVKLDVAIESLETEELLRTADNFTAEVHEAQPVNVSFYNYVKSTLEKRLQLGGANLERSIIDLSKTTSVLCSKTSFFGIRLSRSREPDQSAAEETNGKRARFETDQDYQSTDMHRYHINSDYSETGAFGRDAGAHTENANNRSGRVFPEPAGHSEIPPKKDNIRRDLEALKILRTMTQMSGLLLKTPKSNELMSVIANDGINFEKEWDFIKQMFVKIIDKENKLDPKEQDNLVATLLSYVVYTIFCRSPEHKTYRMNANRSRDYAKRKLELQDKDINELVSMMENHFNIKASPL